MTQLGGLYLPGPFYRSATVILESTTTDAVVLGATVQVGTEKLRVTGGDVLLDRTSITALQVTQNGGGNSTLIVDSLNRRVGVNVTPVVTLQAQLSEAGVGATTVFGITKLTTGVAVAGIGCSMDFNTSSLAVGAVDAARFTMQLSDVTAGAEISYLTSFVMNSGVLQQGIRIVGAGPGANPALIVGSGGGATSSVYRLLVDGDTNVSGTLSVGATIVFEFDRDLAVTLLPNADASLNLGSSARRFATAFANTHSVYAAASDANASASLSNNSLALGIGGATALDVVLSRGAADRLDLASGDSFNIVSGTFQIGTTIVLEADRDLAVTLLPNADGTLNLGSSARRFSTAFAQAFSVYAAASEANASASLSSNSLQFGPGGATALDVQLTRGAADRLDLGGGDSFNISNGNLLISTTILFEADRDLAVTLLPNADNSLNLGSSARRFATAFANTHSVYAAASDANASASLTTNSLQLGAGGVAALDVQLTRGGVDRLDLASGDSFNIVSGTFQIAATIVLEADRDVAITLLPNADNSLALGSASRQWSGMFSVNAAITGDLAIPDFVRQVADLALTNATLVNTDLALTLAVGVHHVYAQVIWVSGAASTEGFRCDFDPLASGLVVTAVRRSMKTFNRDTDAVSAIDTTTNITTDFLVVGVATNTFISEIVMCLEVTTAGTLTLRAAKNTNVPTADTVLSANSHIWSVRRAP